MKRNPFWLAAGLGLAVGGLCADTLYVSPESTNPLAPFATWDTAARVLQDAVDAASPGDTVVVTNGVYRVGERVAGGSTNRVVIAGAITVVSVNGPAVTVIDGGGVVRGVRLTDHAVLSGLTVKAGLADQGGGVWSDATGVITNCVLTGNSADQGGGVFGGRLFRCSLTGNFVGIRTGSGGGASDSALENCLVARNLTWGSRSYGAGAVRSTLYHCTLVSNYSAGTGGGVAHSTLYNSIVYYNSTDNFGEATEFYNSCTSPLPPVGAGNLSLPPEFVSFPNDDLRLRAMSPCIDGGTNLVASASVDLLGESRVWDGNGDGVAVADMGALEFRPTPAVLHVSAGSTNPVAPYSTWATAARVIQEAVNLARPGDTVLLTNGVYSLGATETGGELQRVVLAEPITLASVNGAGATAIDGGGTHRCVLFLTNAVVSGLTLTNGVGQLGGGAWCGGWGVLSNCIVTGNAAGAGGGVHRGTLYNCRLIGNAARGEGTRQGGGASSSTLYNCTLAGNTADAGAGAFASTVFNSTVVGNSAAVEGGGVAASAVLNSILYDNTPENHSASSLRSSCTEPLPAGGVDNVGGPPLFVAANVGDFRLQAGSPCIDRATNLFGFVFVSAASPGEPTTYVYEPTDGVGNSRLIDGDDDGQVAWDMGALEFQSFKPPRFGAKVFLVPAGVQFSLSGEPGLPVQLERASDWNHWEPWMVVVPSSNATVYVDSEPGTNRLYRARVLP